RNDADDELANWQNPCRRSDRAAGQGRAQTARRRDRRPRQALLPGRRADGVGRDLRRAAPPQRRDRGALSRAGARGFALPPRRRGAQPSKNFARARHKVAMLSRGNAFPAAEVAELVEGVRRFLRLAKEEKVPFTAEPKIDGLSCTLRYEGGRLVRGATRGD